MGHALDVAKESALSGGRAHDGCALALDFGTEADLREMNITVDAEAQNLWESAGVHEVRLVTKAFSLSFDLAAIRRIREQSGGAAATVAIVRVGAAWGVVIRDEAGGETHSIEDFGDGEVMIEIGRSRRPAMRLAR